MRTFALVALLSTVASGLKLPALHTPKPYAKSAVTLVLPAAVTTLATQPAVAAAKMGSAVPFTLFGRTSAELFPIQNLALFSWALYLFLPRWRHTATLALVSPTVHSLLYLLVLAHMVRNPVPGMTVDFSSLAGIMPGFTLADGVFAGWLHYCVFDPLVGLGIILDARRSGVPHLLCVPCLIMTCLAGPLGFLAYLVLRTLARMLGRMPSGKPPPGFEWGKTF